MASKSEIQVTQNHQLNKCSFEKGPTTYLLTRNVILNEVPVAKVGTECISL